ncbi:MAG: DUF2336 domain-containing protein [Alphaproteobacteria bacterium]
MLSAEELFALARQKSVDGRARLGEVITDLFLDEGDLTDAERSIMFDILHSLVRDLEVPLRLKLSTLLANDGKAPHDLCVELANDQIEIAYPILTKSHVLEDRDLIEIVHHRTLEHQLAIALREDISEDLSDALIGTGEEKVITNLLENTNSRISRAMMEYLVEESKRVDTFQEPLVKRSDLPPDLAKKMCLWVSVALRNYIVDRYDVDVGDLDELIEDATRKTLEELTREDRQSGDSRAVLLDRLEAEGRLNTDLLIALLEEGLVPLFLAVFRRLTGLSDILARRIMFEPGGEGLAIACKALKTDPEAFQRLFVLSRQTRPVTKKVLKRDTRKTMELYGRISSDTAWDVLHRWRRGSDYLAAIRQLEGGVYAFDKAQ